MKIAVLAGYGPSLLNFRRQLLGAMCEFGHDVIATAPESSLEVKKELARMGVRYIPLPVSRKGLNPLRDLGYVLRLRRLLLSEKVSMTLAYTIKPVVFGSIAARWAGVSESFSLITGLGYVFSAGGARKRLLQRVTKALFKFGLKGNRAVIFQNPDDREMFVRSGIIPSERTVLVNGSGIDLDHFAFSPVPTGAPTFLLIARLIRAKGIPQFVAAAELVKKKHPTSRFRLVGPFDPGPDSIRPDEIREWVDRGLIEFLGEMADVRPALRSATAFVLPSYYREGIPRTILEAMSCGRPIITTSTPGCRETVIDGFNGYLVAPQDSIALASKMAELAENPSRAAEYGRNSRQLAEEKFDVHSVNKIMLETLGLVPGRMNERILNVA
jgi:glycosyltransferase involved in cell wall biosynthesis